MARAALKLTGFDCVLIRMDLHCPLYLHPSRGSSRKLKHQSSKVPSKPILEQHLKSLSAYCPTFVRTALRIVVTRARHSVGEFGLALVATAPTAFALPVVLATSAITVYHTYLSTPE